MHLLFPGSVLHAGVRWQADRLSTIDGPGSERYGRSKRYGKKSVFLQETLLRTGLPFQGLHFRCHLAQLLKGVGDCTNAKR